MAKDVELNWYGDTKKEDMNDGMIRFLIRGTNLVQATAKLLVRKDTTELETSIVTAVEKDSLVGKVSTNSEYAIYNEFGTGRFAEGGGGRQTPWAYEDRNGNLRWTVGMTAQPFMRPGLNNNRDNIEKMAISEGAKAVDK